MEFQQEAAANGCMGSVGLSLLAILRELGNGSKSRRRQWMPDGRLPLYKHTQKCINQCVEGSCVSTRLGLN